MTDRRTKSDGYGSANELTTLLLLVERVGYLPADTVNPMLSLADRVRPMLTKLIKSLES